MYVHKNTKLQVNLLMFAEAKKLYYIWSDNRVCKHFLCKKVTSTVINAKNDTCALAVQNVSHKERSRSETMLTRWGWVGGQIVFVLVHDPRRLEGRQKKQSFVHVVIERPQRKKCIFLWGDEWYVFISYKTYIKDVWGHPHCRSAWEI